MKSVGRRRPGLRPRVLPGDRIAAGQHRIARPGPFAVGGRTRDPARCAARIATSRSRTLIL